MIRVLKQMDEMGMKITKETASQKAEHPILGYLTASEWYKKCCSSSRHSFN